MLQIKTMLVFLARALLYQKEIIAKVVQNASTASHA
jgi:hypothetical protein